MVNQKVPWSLKPLVDPLDPTDVHMRRTPSRSVKNQEGPPLSVEASFFAEYGMRTGVIVGLEGGIFSVTEYSVAIGSAIFVNKDPDPQNTTVTKQTRTSTTNITDPFPSATFTFVYLDSANNIISKLTGPTSLDDFNNLAFLFQVRKFGGVIVTVDDNPIMAYGASMSTIVDLMLNGGIRITGAEISPSGANLEVNVDAGILGQVGRGRSDNANNPNEYTSSAQNPIPMSNFFKAYVDGTGELIVSNATNTLDPTLFNEDGLGTLVAVSPSNNFTRLRVREAAGSEAVIFYYGTEKFSSSADTLGAVEPTFVEHPDTIQISPLADIAIRGDVTDFTAAIISGTAVIKLISRRV